MHVPVLRKEIVHWLSPGSGKRYLDGTLGLGGHTISLLNAVRGQAEVLGLDQDLNSLHKAEMRIKQAGFEEQVFLANASFADFARVLAEIGWKAVDGVILDLGISSYQLEDACRGFSFLLDGPLDMRMDQKGARTAYDLVNKAPYEILKKIIWEYGEEPLAGKIARRICKVRESASIKTTKELAELVRLSYPPQRRHRSRLHPATKTFQALRIAVNRELDALHIFLETISPFLQEGGRLAIISFHSLEDRMVKRAFKKMSRDCICPPRQPVCSCNHVASMRILTKKPILPSPEEVVKNPRARSAKLRVAEKIGPAQEGGDE